MNFEFHHDQLGRFSRMTVADAIREAARCNARLFALQRAFPNEPRAALVDYAYWASNDAPTAELCVRSYEKLMGRA